MPSLREYGPQKRKLYWCRVSVIIGSFISVFCCIIVLAQTLLQPPLLEPLSDPPTNLQQVAIVLRHGDRNPIASYPNDPHHDYVWPEGYSALNKNGMKQLYKIGQRLRGTYRSFISNEYRSAEILVQSSHKERCIMSAQALLAAFYKPSAEDEFEPGFAWRPVPVYQIPKIVDKYIALDAECPRRDREWKQAELDFRLPTNETLQQLYKELTKFSGHNISSFREVVHLIDLLQLQVSKGLALPEWARDFPYPVLEQLYSDFMNLHSGNLMQKRLNGGPLLREILDNMIKRLNGTDDHKLYLYSGHDLTLVTALRTMGVGGNNIKPGYGAALIFELHKVDDGQDHEIKILYLNDAETTEPRVIKIPGCGEPCLLDNLAKIWKPVLPENWESECLT